MCCFCRVLCTPIELLTRSAGTLREIQAGNPSASLKCPCSAPQNSIVCAGWIADENSSSLGSNKFTAYTGRSPHCAVPASFWQLNTKTFGMIHQDGDDSSGPSHADQGSSPGACTLDADQQASSPLSADLHRLRMQSNPVTSAENLLDRIRKSVILPFSREGSDTVSAAQSSHVATKAPTAASYTGPNGSPDMMQQRSESDGNGRQFKPQRAAQSQQSAQPPKHNAFDPMQDAPATAAVHWPPLNPMIRSQNEAGLARSDRAALLGSLAPVKPLKHGHC